MTDKDTEQWMRDHAELGAVLADQVAQYFVVFPKQHRERQIRLWLESMRRLIPINEAADYSQGTDLQ